MNSGRITLGKVERVTFAYAHSLWIAYILLGNIFTNPAFYNPDTVSSAIGHINDLSIQQ